jgi:hypothetical protein
MEEIAARAALVPAPDVGDGLTTSIARSEIEEVLAAEEAPIELVLDVTRFADGETGDTRSISVSWERSDLEQLLKDAQGDQVILTFDREALRQATDDDVEAHGFREKILVLAVAATAATGAAATAAAEPGAFLGAGTPVAQSLSPDDRAFARTAPVSAADAVASPDDRAFARTSPVSAPDAGVSPDDRAFPRTSPVSAPDAGVSPDDRAFPRTSPVSAPDAGVSPDDRAFQRPTPVSAPDAGVSPDDRAFPRTSPVSAPDAGVSPDDRALPRSPIAAPDTGLSPDDRAFPRTSPVSAPATGTVSDPGTSWAPSPTEAVAVAGALALLITGAFFLVGSDRRRIRPV